MEKIPLFDVHGIIFIFLTVSGHYVSTLEYYKDHILWKKGSNFVKYIGPGLCNVSASLDLKDKLTIQSLVNVDFSVQCPITIHNIYALNGRISFNDETVYKADVTGDRCRNFKIDRKPLCPIQAGEMKRFSFGGSLSNTMRKDKKGIHALLSAYAMLAGKWSGQVWFKTSVKGENFPMFGVEFQIQYHGGST